MNAHNYRKHQETLPWDSYRLYALNTVRYPVVQITGVVLGLQEWWTV